MQQAIHDFQNLLKKEKIDMPNEHLKDILFKFDFIFYPDILQTEKKVKQYENNSKIIIIDEYMENDIKYYVLCFDYKLIFLPQEDKTGDLVLPSIFTQFEDNDKYFITSLDPQAETDTENRNFFIEIINFSKEFMISNINMQHFWRIVVNCLSGFLIKKGYQNSRNRHDKYLKEKFIEFEEKRSNFLNKSYIKIRNLGQGSGGIVELIYHIFKEEVLALKIPFYERQHLIERERRNYLSIRHPFIVQYIGYIEFANNQKYLLLEYVEGETLDKYDLSNLDYQEKSIIILELLLSIHYLHSRKYIYRDLRLSNIMINQNKDAILIDFDHVRKENDETEDEMQTINFIDQVVAPEENKTYKSDVYSLGFIFYFLLYGKYPINNNKMEINENFSFKSCLEDDPTERPDMISMISIFYAIFYSKEKLKDKKVIYLILLSANQNIPQAQFYLGLIYGQGKYVTQDINKAIHYYSLASNQNIPQAQYNLGLIYYEGLYVTQDINKAIHYFILASNQNIPEAQYNLGLIYYEGLYVTQDINKAIHYYSLASNQNNPEAQYNLGLIYYEGLHVTRDINKAIHYYSLASNQNIPEAQYNLGLIYYEGLYVTQDINKAIHYFSLASNQNDIQAQLHLGVIYHEGTYVTRDINKAIHYFSLASNQNDIQAQLHLGVIYHEGTYVTRDINKAIHYFSLASNQNIPEAQYNLGLIYSSGKYVTRDINKAIHYYSLAANQNYPEAQFNLGIIYSSGKYVTRDINKAIHYYSLAANQNYPEAQYNLGIIYSSGKYVTRDINKAIHYYSLAANQNFPEAQFNLGLIYYEGLYVTQDINKAIHYFTLASNQNDPEAQFYLGLIYDQGKYVTRDINKVIYYYSLASNQNYPEAQYNLGLIYYKGRYVTQDINKAIHYFSLASNQNNPEAQFYFCLIYCIGKYIKQAIKKGLYYIMLASINNHRQANFAHGFLLHEGKYVKKDISKAIHYYKEASSFNNQYSKNNLGIIYKHGYNEIKGNIWNAIVFFEEAIRQKNDYLSMYNLAHIYMYDSTDNQDLNKSIDLLISSMSEFQPSLNLLCIALLLKFDFNIETIMQELKQRTDLTRSSIKRIFKEIDFFKINFDVIYELYQYNDYLYNIELDPIESFKLELTNEKVVPLKYSNAKDLSSEFYKGFGEDLYNQI